MLALRARALSSGRAFSRQLYVKRYKISLNKINWIMKKDLQILKTFWNNYNGCSYIQELNWISNFDLQIFTDSAGGKTVGCASYLRGGWTVLNWE